MHWRQHRGHFYAEGARLGYNVLPKRGGKYYIKAYLPGGAEHRLPFQDFDTAQAAMTWADEHEAEQAEYRARYAAEEPIRL